MEKTKQQTSFPFRIAFGPGCEETMKIIGRDAEYSPETGYGFVTARSAKEDLFRIPAVNNGFTSYPEKSDPDGAPAYFRLDVPKEGNYTADLTLSCPDPETGATVFSERRRCVLWHARTGEDGLLRLSFTANVCRTIPRGKKEAYRDGALDFTLQGARLSGLRVRETPEAPTVFLLGDSTVTDQPADLPYDPRGCYCGWGQMLPAFFKEGIAVSNHAHSGLTTASFRSEGHWEIVSSALRPGDFVLIQFGHNDQKCKNLAARGGYAENLMRYVGEIRLKGATPILVAPVSRSIWDLPGGGFHDLLKDWADACRAVAESTETPLLDLHAESIRFFLEQGEKAARRFFHPGDRTHFNDYGGYLTASFVARGLRNTELCPFLRKTAGMPDPTAAPSALPDPPGGYASPFAQPLSADFRYCEGETPSDSRNTVQSLSDFCK